MAQSAGQDAKLQGLEPKLTSGTHFIPKYKKTKNACGGRTGQTKIPKKHKCWITQFWMTQIVLPRTFDLEQGIVSDGSVMNRPEPKTGDASVVQGDFYLATAADIVADPSAPDAFVNGIMENKEWIWDNGIIREAAIDSYARELKEAKSKQLEEVKINLFKNFLSSL